MIKIGLTVKLPVDWLRDTESDKPKYASENGFMDFRISSANEAETDLQWMQRNRADLESDFQTDYLKNVTESTISIVDGKARVLTYEFSWIRKHGTESMMYILFQVNVNSDGIRIQHGRPG